MYCYELDIEQCIDIDLAFVQCINMTLLLKNAYDLAMSNALSDLVIKQCIDVTLILSNDIVLI
jgi:hypothetical protein